MTSETRDRGAVRPRGAHRCARSSALAVVVLSVIVAACGAEAPSPSPVAQVSPTPSPSASPAPTPSPSPTPVPTPTPEPTPVRVPAPLTGQLVSEAVAARNPIAVMIDDLRAARPQSGLSGADIVWHAPAEGGIPRYMAIYQSKLPKSIGPVRSARVYYILWAAELNAVYAHSGGSPKALALLRRRGDGDYVFDANEFRYGGGAFNRISSRPAPHNVYTSGARMHRLGIRLGAKDGEVKPIWTFGPDLPLEQRPTGGSIRVPYPRNTVTYRYDRATNTYKRAVSGEKRQIDQSSDKQVAPKNVVVMHVKFINSGDSKNRLEGDIIGRGKAEIMTNGGIIRGTWKKASETAPTRFFDAAGDPVVFTTGQTFIQVVPTDLKVTIKAGTPPA